MSGITPSVVNKRHVFYLSGFDPRGSAYYHRLYKDESAKQAKLLGAEINVGDRVREQASGHRWRIQTEWRQSDFNWHVVDTDYVFLNWDDVVRKYWSRTALGAVAKGLWAYGSYLRNGMLTPIMKHYPGPMAGAFYPLAILLILTTLSALVSWLSFLAVSAAAGAVAGWIAAVAVLAGSLYGTGKISEKLGALWMLRTYYFANQLAVNNSKPLVKHLQKFVNLIKARQENDPADEVLIIGHSMGAIAAVHLAAMFTKEHPELAGNIKLVTIGQCIPLQSHMPQANLLREHLDFLGSGKGVQWIDFAARADALAFVSERKLASESAIFPAVNAVRFFNKFTPEAYKQLRKNKLKTHFQYLMATQIVGNYDYFRMTTGYQPLAIHQEEQHAI